MEIADHLNEGIGCVPFDIGNSDTPRAEAAEAVC